MTTTPKIGVVLVTYNRSRGLSLTLDSLLGQDFDDFSVLVCDDHSTDDTATILSNYSALDSRIRAFRQSENVGMPGNLNSGLQLMAGTGVEYIVIAHDADVLRSDCLLRWVELADDHPSVGVVFNRYAGFGNPEEASRASLRDAFPRIIVGSVLLERVFYRRWRFDSPIRGSALVRVSALQSVGNELDPQYGPWSDVDLWMRLAESWDFGYVNEPILKLANRTEFPSQFSYGVWTRQRALSRMFLASRRRHFARRRVRLALELARHRGHQLLSIIWFTILELRRRCRSA